MGQLPLTQCLLSESINSVWGICPQPLHLRNKWFIIESGHVNHIQSHLDIPGFPQNPMGEKCNSEFHIIHTLHGRLLLHKGIWIYTKILYKLIQTSVSCVNVMLSKDKVGANSEALRGFRSFQNQTQVSGRVWISGSRFLFHANRPNGSNFRAM